MRKIEVELGERSYNIEIGSDFSSLLQSILALLENKRIFIVSDGEVYPLHGEKLARSFQKQGVEVYSYIMPAGEKSKSLETVQKIYGALLDGRFDRNDVVLALGGGVVGDTAGFAAATFCRGLQLVQMPTTLLSQVDSSVGGKTGVNYRMVKNTVGSFYQPRLVCIYPDYLKTLDIRQLKNGMAEAVVHAVIADRKLFEFIEKNLDKILQCDSDAMEYLIAENCGIKRDVIIRDEYDKGIRAILNFGHTIGHAVEACSNYALLHGEAVSVGVEGAARLAVRLNMLTDGEYRRIHELLTRLGLPVAVSGLSAADIYRKMQKDKKRRGDRLFFILPSEIGTVHRVEYNDEAVLEELLGELTEETE